MERCNHSKCLGHRSLKIVTRLSQAALIVYFLTGAGAGIFLAYATYMTRSQGAVRLGTLTPIVNILVW